MTMMRLTPHGILMQRLVGMVPQASLVLESNLRLISFVRHQQGLRLIRLIRRFARQLMLVRNWLMLIHVSVKLQLQLWATGQPANQL